MRAISGRPIAWTFELDDANGIPINADPSTNVLVTVLAGDGTSIVLGAIATDVPIIGVYEYVIPAQVKLDTLSVTATAIVGGLTQTYTDEVRVCGSRILTPADIRADPILSKLGANPQSRRVLIEALDATEDLIADALGFPAALEGARLNFDARRGMVNEVFAYGDVQTGIFTGIPGLGFGFGGARLLTPGCARPQQVYEMQINGNTVQDDVLAQFQPGNGYITWTGGRSWPSANYVIWLSHGMGSIPADLRWAAAKLARYIAKRTPITGQGDSLLPERTASLTTEGATIVFAIPSPDRPTGIPEIDAVLMRYATASVV